MKKITKDEYKRIATYVVNKHLRNCKKLRDAGYKPAPIKGCWQRIAAEYLENECVGMPPGLSEYQEKKLKAFLVKEVAFRKVINS